MTKYKFAGYPYARLYAKAGDKENIHQFLWGDKIEVTGPEVDGWTPVIARNETGWIESDKLQEDQILEVVFVDIGQGDGCLVVTPDDRHIVIDAGISDNMFRFLRWRYDYFNDPKVFDEAIITHPDADHYKGFYPLVDHPKVSFKNVYHNGIIEDRTERKPLGESTTHKRKKYLTDLMFTDTELKKFLNDKKRWQNPKGRRFDKPYPKLLDKFVSNNKAGGLSMLHTTVNQTDYVPGYEKGNAVSMEVLGPITETIKGKKSLKWLVSKGKTKNGHSVVLKVKIGQLTMLLGGDLNSVAENYLLENYTGVECPPKSVTDENLVIDIASNIFRADVAKCCHHGSSDFTNTFIKAVNASVTVISSGDEESHAHPRPETLGAIGQYGRGERPLIFSTELARSTREKEPAALKKKIISIRKKIFKAKTQKTINKYLKELYELEDQLLSRNVITYGAINVRTDGDKLVIAYKLEEKRKIGNVLTVWDLYVLKRVGSGFVYV